jgi:hypothetical protein
MGTYTVEFLDAGFNATDISVFVHTLDDSHFYSDGRISTSALTLQASFGQFITDSRGGLTPIIAQFDKIRITYIDSDLNQYQHIFEVINDLGQFTKQSEYLLPLTLEGRERNLQLIPFSGFFDPPISHKEMVGKILSAYTGDRDQTTQPVFITPINELPDFNPNFWDFQYIDNCLDAIVEVLRQANLSVAAGGGGDRFGMIYKDSLVGNTFMEIDFISQGTNNSGDPFVTITGDAVFNPIQIVDKIKQPVTGTVKVARGRPGTGGTPRQGDQYRARLEFYERTQTYNNATTYPIDAFVSHGVSTTNPELSLVPQVWQALTQNTGVTPVAGVNWKTVSAFEFIGDIQYSPFTIDKASLYKNECTNFDAAFDSDDEGSPKMLDCNIVIEDEETKRDWVYFRAFSDEIADLTTTNRKYLFLGNNYYPGFRILVDSQLGTLNGAFSQSLDAFGTGLGNDPNGKSYVDNAVIRIDEDWFVLKDHADFDQLVVRQEGLFEFNIAFVSGSRFPASDTTNANRRLRQAGAGVPNAWRALGDQFLANDCLHSPTIIENVDGLIRPVGNTGSNPPFYTTNSGVRIVYEYGTATVDDTDIPDWRKVLDNITGFFPTSTGFLTSFATNAALALYSLFLTPQYRNAGWWITFTAPWPFNTGNSITEEVGELYGGSSLTELREHSFFDMFNQRVAYSGKDGWNQPDSADLMEITGVTFLFNLDLRVDGTTIPFTGDIPCSWWCIDSNGTLWKQKKNLRFLKDSQRFTFNFGDFTPVYRARSPFGISNIVTNILVPELEIRERVIPSRIQVQGFMLELSYDEHGRYLPNLLETIIKPTIFDLFQPGLAGLNVAFDGVFDYLQWVKTPIAIENGSSLGITPDRAIFPEFSDYPNISNVEQLQRAATADWEVAFFQFEQYTLTQNDRAENSLQDTVYMREEFLIPDAEQLLVTTNAWVTATNYILNDIVQDAGIIYEALTAHLSSGGNQPPSSDWNSLGAVAVPNTREVTVAEIALSVTNGKDWERNMTLVRRIPRKLS